MGLNGLNVNILYVLYWFKKIEILKYFFLIFNKFLVVLNRYFLIFVFFWYVIGEINKYFYFLCKG